MANGSTPHYGYILPEVSSDTAAWGGHLNSNWTQIDQQFFNLVNPANLIVSSTPGSSIKGTLTFQNASVTPGQQTRWVWAEDTVAESGGNAGSNLSLNAYSDVGAQISIPLTFIRATGAASFGGALSVTGATTLSGTSSHVGAATFSSTLSATGSATFGSTLGVTGKITAGSFEATGAVSCDTTLNVGGAANLATSLVVGTTLTVQGAAVFNGSTVNTVGASLATHYFLRGATIVGGITTGNGTNDFYLQNIVVGPYLLLDASGNFQFNGSGAGQAYKPGGGSWSATSDARIKTVEREYRAGLDEVLQLRPVVYTYKGNDGEPGSERGGLPVGRRFVGFVAQELEGIMPDMVSRRDGYVDGEKVTDLRDVDVSSLVYALVNAVKSLKAEVEALKTR